MSYTEQPAPPQTEQRAQDGPADQQRAAWPDSAPEEALPQTDRPGAVDAYPRSDQETAATAESPKVSDQTNGSGPTDASAADRPAHAPSDGQLPPGGSAADPVAALWGADLVRGYRARWEQVQLSFVDDPQRAASEAGQLLDEALSSLTGALTSQKESLDDWQRDDGGDTEVLRTAIKHYREFLDRLLGM
jgi:hypothetical protein